MESSWDREAGEVGYARFAGRGVVTGWEREASRIFARF